MEREEESVEFISTFQAFHNTAPDDDMISPNELLPPSDEYRQRTMCYIIADNDFQKANELYDNTPISEVWQAYAIRRAISEAEKENTDTAIKRAEKESKKKRF